MTAVKNSASNLRLSPAMMRSSPMGTTHEAGGDMTRTLPRALWSASISSPVRRVVLVLGEMLARSHTCWATDADTREKLSMRVFLTVWPRASCIIRISRPSSTPWGWGLISSGSRGSSWAARSNTIGSAALGSLYTNDMCGLAMTVCSRYASMLVRPPR